MTLSTAVYLVCVLSTACSDKSKVSITTNLDPAVKVEILLFGTESLGTFSGKEITLDVPDTAKDRKGLGYDMTAPYREGTADTGKLIARVPTACGTIDFCVQIASGRPLHATLVGRKRPPFDVCEDEFYVTHVDNRDGPAHTLAAGGFSYVVAPHAVSTIAVQLPRCAAMASVTLDGQEIGTLPIIEDGREPAYYDLSRHQLVVDPAGTHCYSIGTASYAPKGSTLASGTSGDYLHGRKLYEVEAQITNMFEAVPDTIQSVGGHGHRTSLTETTCSPP